MGWAEKRFGKVGSSHHLPGILHRVDLRQNEDRPFEKQLAKHEALQMPKR
jgi:hypothetical protein